MELKKNETDYTNDYDDKNTYSNPSDILFNQDNLDTPYQITNINVKSKKSDQDTRKIILIVAGIIIFIGLTIFRYNSRHKFDGTYELIGAINYGVYFTVEELEQNSGMDIYARLEVKGTNCKFEYDYTYIKESFSAYFKIDGNDISMQSGGEYLYGKYDPKDETITLTEGGMSLVLKKID